jgi:hypothetical protein
MDATAFTRDREGEKERDSHIHEEKSERGRKGMRIAEAR